MSYEDGRVIAEALAAPTRPEVLGGLRHAWVWSETAAPRRVTAEGLHEALASDRGRLSIRVPVSDDAPASGLRLIAAPAEMWTEVGEDLLPSWPLPENGRLAIPHDSARPWRLRLAGEGRGSWWLDLPAGRTNATLVPTAAGDHRLRLTGGGGDALPAAGLTVLSDERRRQHVVAQLRADEDGRLTLPALPDQAELLLVATAPEHAATAFSALPSALPAEVRLVPGSRIVGRVADADGAPLAGVRVRAEAWLEERVGASTARDAETDADGRFALTALPRGTAAVAAALDGHVPFRAEVEVGVEPVDLGTIRLAKGRNLAVLVVDERGEPVPGAALDAGPGPRPTTDAHGRARLGELPAAATITVRTSAEGHLPTETVARPPLPDELRIVLERAFRLEGRLVDADGVPVSEGTLRFQLGRSYDDRELLPGGRFELDLPAGAAVQLTLRSPITQEVRLTVEPGQGGETRDLGDLAAPRGIAVRGRVLGAADGAPVAGARVWTPRPSEDGDVVAWVHGDLLSVTSDADGAFTLAGLPRRPVVLRFDAPGLARLHRAVEPPADADVVDLGDVTLERGATVRVAVGDAVGESVEAATARVDLRGDWLELDMLTASVVAGEAVLRHVPTGRATLTVLAGRELLCEEALTVGSDDEELAVDCADAGNRVSGRVTFAGEPASEGHLMWLPPEVAAVPGIILNTSTPLGARRQEAFGVGRPQVDVPVDVVGRFASERLRPGPWEVVYVPASGATTAPLHVELPEAERHEVELAFGAEAITGVVVDEDDTPVAGARVEDAATRAFAITRADGRFALAGLEPGLHRLHARAGERTSELVEAVLEPDRAPEPVVLRVAERADDRVEVVVLDPDGAPAPGAFVFLEGDRGTSQLLTADLAGRASALLTPPHPSRLRAAAVSDGRWSFGAWTALDEARKESLTLVGEETGSLELTSREAHGVPEIVSADGWDLSWLLTRIGARPFVDPELPLRLEGLPAGSYRIALGDFAAAVDVRDRDLATLELP